MTTNDELEIINDFKETLNKHANEHGFKITETKGWTERKIESMALNNRICCCDPSRTCPCEIGIKEVNKCPDHMCKCSIFTK
ncbi:MAG: hypothetical protein Q7J10_09210 [Methanosarcinaceae archaeon]|nr:hypothetical protein [Methanosarcinaceae archaeon]